MKPAERIKRVMDEIGHVASQYGVKSQDQQFMRDVLERKQTSLSKPQENWLKDIEARVFGEDDDAGR